MTNPSRRRLARYGASQLVAKKPVSRVARELSSVLIANKARGEAESLASDVAWELERMGKAANTKVTTASPLTDSLKREIKDFIKTTAKVDSVILDEQTDKNVLGGLRVETSRQAWDKTIARALADIRKEF